MRPRRTVRSWQNSALAYRQNNSSTVISDTDAATTTTGVTSTGTQTSEGTTGSIASTDGTTYPTNSQDTSTTPTTDTTSTVGTTSTQPTSSLPTSPTSTTPTTSPSSTPASTSSSTPSSTSTNQYSVTPSASTSSSPPSSTPSSASDPSNSGPSSSSSPSASTTSPPSSSSSASLRQTTIGTSTFIQTINGQLTTSLEPIVTTLSEPTSGGLSSAANKGIIAGSVVGVCALLILAFALVMFYRHHRHKKLDFFKRKREKPRSMLLAGEDLDDYDMGPPMASYRDYPGSLASGSASGSVTGHASPSRMGRDASYTHSAGGSIHGSPLDPHGSYPRVDVGGSKPKPSPHLMGMRTSDTGSLFQEQVWPPPRSPFVDPLVSTDDLTQIVDNVMGPSRAGTSASSPNVPPTVDADTRLRGGHESGRSFDSSSVHGPGHAKSPSQAALLPPASPRSPTVRTPLFVTNMGGETASIYSLQSPPSGGDEQLAEHALSTEGEPMGEAL